MKKGIDISYWQGTVNFNAVKNSGIEYAIFREGCGKYIDKKFLEYVNGAKSAGLPILGVYHFAYALSIPDAVTEAVICIDNMKKAGLDSSCIVFYDFEYDTVTSAAKKGITLTPEQCQAFTTAFCEKVKQLGFVPGVYTNLDYYKNWYRRQIGMGYKVWLADYTGGPDIPCLVQQYSSKGSVSGIKGNVDMNYYYGEDFIIPEVPVNKPDLSIKKDIDTLANEVISGLWGSGTYRKNALTQAGYSYSTVQNRVNEIVNGTVKQPAPVIPDKITEVKTNSFATKFDQEVAGDWTTKTDLYCRNDAGTNKPALCLIPKGTRVKCYGFYTPYNGVKWLLIQATVNDVQYTGFSSGAYLKREVR